jgi:hypothetical protein
VSRSQARTIDRARTILTGLGVAVFAIGLCGFGLHALQDLASDRGWLRSFEFPLGDVQDIAVDRDGRLLLALGFYGRIQLYDAGGRFIRGWSADSLGGAFTVAFQGPDLVQSYANRRRSTILFDINGRRRDDRAASSPDSTEHRTGATAVTAPDGSVLSVRLRYLWPAIVRQTGGDAVVLITGPWYLRPLTGPLPTWSLMLAGCLLVWLVQRGLPGTRA